MKKKEMAKKFDELASISANTRAAALKGAPEGIGMPAVRMAAMAMSAAFAVAALIVDEQPDIVALADEDPVDIIGRSLGYTLEKMTEELR